MAAKFFTGLPMDGPDPECVQGYGQSALESERTVPQSSVDHSRTGKRAERRTPAAPVPLTLLAKPPAKFCDENPLAGL
jgi:hypothetical protein